MTPVTTGLVVAVLLDLLIGDPNYPLHPVRLIGRLIAATERRLRTIKCLGIGGGVMLVLTVCTTVLGAYTGIRLLLTTSHPAMAWTFDAYCIYSCIALRDMLRHATPIAWALKENDLELARRKLKWIVGRDVTVLDAPAVARAAVESIAESLVDGFLAPLFWMTIAALTAHAWSLPVLPCAVAATLVYRCINTLDSMVGYRNERYMFFGRAAARFDDLLNFVPARLSLPLLWISSIMLRLDAAEGARTARRDRLKHASPNSAHPESFVAGALGLKLGGPTVYPHGTVDKPWIGSGSADAGPQHIRRVGMLSLTTGIVTTLLCMLILEIAQ